ncbi:Na+/H+ antiporter [Legionella moravica]|uniref:Na /H antiporter n=1 Tax=Legionella moravica TaxID=39962 RepID=A0A378JZE0_9GAMM|nr:cation:proton antiporter [Legionella moravica]KTD30777.1 Na+/H+ antiporter [Legionella moravica]STX63400.1 Na /H antiporter [Legionella moravica]
MRSSKWWFFAVSICPMIAFAAGSEDHADPVASVLLGVTCILFFAIMGRYIARLFHQPGVLGELLMGVIVGNVSYFFGNQLIVILREGSSIFNVMKEVLNGVSIGQAVSSVIPNPFYAQQITQALSGAEGTEYLKIAYIVDIFSRLGVIFLLFMVGLESSLEELKHTGKESILVALIGVLAPMILGFLAAYFLIPASHAQADLFIAATLSATSIGITARVLKEMNKLRTREARTILGAAMLDDILGLILLAVVSSVVISNAVDFGVVVRIIISSLLFFAGTLVLGPIFLRKSVHLLRRLEPWESKLFISFIFVMALSWLASFVHLAAIIGAFAAGVIIHDDYFKTQESHQSENRSIHHLISPLESILAPMFFMVIGLQVKLETFCSWNVIILSSGLILAAIIGKLLSGLGANRKDDRLLIGIGMLPRGEVGLVFASIGRTLGVISDELFSSIVLMVLVTTFIAPPLLKARFANKNKELKV